MQNFDRPYIQSPAGTIASTLPREVSGKQKHVMVLIGSPAKKLTKVLEGCPKQVSSSERQQLYVQHRLRVQNAKSVIDSKPPPRPNSGCPIKEMTFMELLNTVRNALHTTQISPRTFTKTPEAVQRSRQGARLMSFNLGGGDGPHNTGAAETRRCREKSTVSFSRSHCALRSSEPVMRRPDVQKLNQQRHRSWQSVPCQIPKDYLYSQNKKPPQEGGKSRGRRKGAKRPKLTDKPVAPVEQKTNMPNSNIRNTKTVPHADVRVGSNANVKSTVNLRLTGSERDDVQAHSENLSLKELREREVSKKYNIPQHVLKRYESLMMVRNLPLLRKLLRPKIFFDIEVKGLRPLGRILIQMYTEACPEVVLEFVRACTLSNRDRINFTRLLPPLWLEGELSLTDNKTLTAHTIEHDTDVLDHGSGAGILSFPSRYVRGSKRRFLSFSISFKPLQVLNGKRIAFGRVRRGHWILDAIQDYGTNSGKPKREIMVTKCGLLQ